MEWILGNRHDNGNKQLVLGTEYCNSPFYESIYISAIGVEEITPLFAPLQRLYCRRI